MIDTLATRMMAEEAERDERLNVPSWARLGGPVTACERAAEAEAEAGS